MRCCDLVVMVAVVVAATRALAQTPHPAEKEYEERVAEARTAFAEAEKTARADLIEKLEAAKTEATKDGDLDGAVALRDRIAELKAADVEPETGRPAKGLVGRYEFRYSHGERTESVFAKDGTIACVLKNGKAVVPPAKGSVIWTRDGKATVGYIYWLPPESGVERITVGKDGLIQLQWFSDQHKVTAEVRKAK